MRGEGREGPLIFAWWRRSWFNELFVFVRLTRVRSSTWLMTTLALFISFVFSAFLFSKGDRGLFGSCLEAGEPPLAVPGLWLIQF